VARYVNAHGVSIGMAATIAKNGQIFALPFAHDSEYICRMSGLKHFPTT
jgi:hypothetical protein